MNAEIITVGTELLLGDILNTNCQFLSQQLAAMGIGLLYQSTVGDNADRLQRTLSAAMERSDIVLITGGLGPTQDDITRETLCKVLHLPADMHEPSRARIEEFFRLRGTEPTENNYKQACLPRGCTVFPNDHGTAPGCAVERYGQAFILLPGPPRELVPMFHQYVAPYLSKFSGGTIFSRTVGVFGMSESAVDERLADLMQGENPTVAPYCRDGEVVLRVTAKAADADTARALCEPIVEQICERIGTYVYGVDCGSLQKAVVSALKEKGKKIATAESCTAGMLSQSLTQIPGVSSVFGCGVTAYSAQTKAEVLGVPQAVLDEQGTVCADVAAAMADGVRRLGEADIGVAITGEAGPEAAEDKPVGTVFIALADAQRVWVKQLTLGNRDREYIRRLATLHTLDLTRQYLEALPHTMEGGRPLVPVAPPAANAAQAAPPERTEKTPKKHTALKLACLLAAILLLATAILSVPSCFSRPTSNAALYQSLYELYSGESVPPTGEHNFPQGMLPRFYSLYNRNADIGGWVHIPGTAINYPVMKDAGGDYYATHSYDKQPSDYGVPYFDAACAADGSGRTLIVYGNATDDGQMFSDLLKYRDLAFLKAHATVTLNTLYSEAEWGVFAVCALDTSRGYVPDYTRTFFVSDTDFERFIEAIGRYSLYDAPALPNADDTLLFLSVDASDIYGVKGTHLVVAARRLDAGETVDTAFTEKAQPLLPSVTTTTTTESALPGVPDTQVPDTQPESEQPTEEPWEPPTEQDWLNPDDPLFTEEPGPEDPTTAAPETGTTSTTAKPTTSTTVTTVTTVTTTTVPTTTTTAEPTTTTSATTTAPPTTVTTVTTAASTTMVPTTTVTVTTTTVTTTTTAPTTAPTTKPQPTPATDYVEPGTIPESQFMALFRLKDTRTGKVFAPQTKEELQLALTHIVKYECGYSKIAVNSTAAWEAQAIAAYSYVLNYCKNGGTYSLPLKTVDLNNASDRKIYDAVGKVVGYKILNIKGGSLKNMLCSTMYANNSCGVTASCQYVYTQALPFLQSVPSVYDTDEYIYKYTGNKTLHSSTTTITLDEFIAAAEAWLDAKISKSAVLGYDTKEGAMPLYVTSWDGGEGGYVINTNFYYTLNGKKTYIMGKHIRVIINNYSDSNLRSHSFTVTDYDSGTGKMTLSVKGYGHGLGLSQMGAAGYANEAGWSAAQIINHYYSLGADKDYRLVAPVWE